MAGEIRIQFTLADGTEEGRTGYLDQGTDGASVTRGATGGAAHPSHGAGATGNVGTAGAGKTGTVER